MMFDYFWVGFLVGAISTVLLYELAFWLLGRCLK